MKLVPESSCGARTTHTVIFCLALLASSCSSFPRGPGDTQYGRAAVSLSQSFNGRGVRPNEGETPASLTQRLVEAQQFSYYVNSEGTKVDLRSYDFTPDETNRSPLSPVRQTLTFTSWCVFSGGAWVLIPDLDFSISGGYEKAELVTVELKDKLVYEISPQYTLRLNPWDPDFPAAFIQDLYIVEAAEVTVKQVHSGGLEAELARSPSIPVNAGAKLDAGSSVSFDSSIEWAVVGDWTPRSPRQLLETHEVSMPFAASSSDRFDDRPNLVLRLLETRDSGSNRVATLRFQAEDHELAEGQALRLRDDAVLMFIECHESNGALHARFRYSEVSDAAKRDLGYRVEFAQGGSAREEELRRLLEEVNAYEGQLLDSEERNASLEQDIRVLTSSTGRMKEILMAIQERTLKQYVPGIEVRSKQVFFDLRRWVPVAAEDRYSSRECPIVTRTTHTLAKIKPEVGEFVATYATSSGPDPIFSCDDYPMESVPNEDRIPTGKPNLRRWLLNFDITTLPLFEERSVTHRVTSWNAFQNYIEEFAETLIVYPCREAEIRVALPESMECRADSLKAAKYALGPPLVAVEAEEASVRYDSVSHEAVMTIHDPRLGFHYRLSWDWKRQ